MTNYGISAQMKTFIDRTYPIWQHLGKKEEYQKLVKEIKYDEKCYFILDEVQLLGFY